MDSKNNIFAVYFEIELLKKPSSFDLYFSKYNPPHTDIHITLIQPRVISESQVASVFALVKKFSTSNQITTADKVFETKECLVDQELQDKNTVMFSIESDGMSKFQSALRTLFSDGFTYKDIKNKNYEYNFVPHITLGSDIPNEEVVTIKQDLEEGGLKGIIKNITLVFEDSEIGITRKFRVRV